jgi:hypothetical protein
VEPSTKRGRGPVVAAIAATLVLAGGVAASQIAGDADPPHAEHSTAGSPVATPRGYLAFRVSLRHGDRLVGGGVGSRGEQAVSVRTPHGAIDLTTQSTLEQGSWRVDPAAEHVTVRGHAGFYGDGFQAVYPHFDNDVGTPSPGATSPPPAPEENSRQAGLRTLGWQYADRQWAMLRTQSRGVTKVELVRLANGVDFGGRTPMRLAIAMTRTPEKLVFTGWDTRYVRSPDQSSLSAIHFRAAAGMEDVTVELDRGSIPNGAHRLPFTVHGHRAYTAPGYGAVVFVQESAGFYLQVTALYPSDGSSYRPKTLEPIADLVRVTNTPADVDSWFEATIALPKD